MWVFINSNNGSPFTKTRDISVCETFTLTKQVLQLSLRSLALMFDCFYVPNGIFIGSTEAL